MEITRLQLWHRKKLFWRFCSPGFVGYNFLQNSLKFRAQVIFSYRTHRGSGYTVLLSCIAHGSFGYGICFLQDLRKFRVWLFFLEELTKVSATYCTVFFSYRTQRSFGYCMFFFQNPQKFRVWYVFVTELTKCLLLFGLFFLQHPLKFRIWYSFLAEPTEVSGMVLFSYRTHRSFQVWYLFTTEPTEVSGMELFSYRTHRSFRIQALSGVYPGCASRTQRSFGYGIISYRTHRSFRIRYNMWSNTRTHRSFGYGIIFLLNPQNIRVWYLFITEPTGFFRYGICSLQNPQKCRIRALSSAYPGCAFWTYPAEHPATTWSKRS